MEEDCHNKILNPNQMAMDPQDEVVLGLGSDVEVGVGAEAEIVGVDVICRLCANQSDRIIGIYSEEGISNDLANKMNLYLPIKVAETDNLPLQCCWTCASTVLAWHELVLASVEADRRLRNELIVTTAEDNCEVRELQVADCRLRNELIVSKANTNGSLESIAYEMETNDNSSEHEDNGADPDPTDASLSAFCQAPSPGISVMDDTTDSSGKQAIDNVSFGKLWINDKVYMEELKEEYIEMSEADISYSQNNEEEVEEIKENSSLPAKPQQSPTKNRKVGKKEGARRNSSKIKDELVDDPGEEIKMYEVLTVNGENGQQEYSFLCPYCPIAFSTEVDMVNHLKAQHSDKKEWLEEMSDKADGKTKGGQRRRYTKLDREIVNGAKIEVDGRVYYNCKDCGKSLHSPYTYLWHMRIHTGERPFVCDLCGKQFRVSQGLVRHLRETHEGVKNYPCDLCGRMFASRRNVEEHRRIHTNERPYICDLCGKTFKQKASLFVHNRSHTSTYPYRCSYCNQGFRARGPLLLHVTKHTGEKPYPCETCGRCFRIKYELKRHQLIHSDNKPFSCSECGLSFRQKRYLKNHQKINHNQNRSV